MTVTVVASEHPVFHTVGAAVIRNEGDTLLAVDVDLPNHRRYDLIRALLTDSEFDVWADMVLRRQWEDVAVSVA